MCIDYTVQSLRKDRKSGTQHHKLKCCPQSTMTFFHQTQPYFYKKSGIPLWQLNKHPLPLGTGLRNVILAD